MKKGILFFILISSIFLSQNSFDGFSLAAKEPDLTDEQKEWLRSVWQFTEGKPDLTPEQAKFLRMLWERTEGDPRRQKFVLDEMAKKGYTEQDFRAALESQEEPASWYFNLFFQWPIFILFIFSLFLFVIGYCVYRWPRILWPYPPKHHQFEPREFPDPIGKRVASYFSKHSGALKANLGLFCLFFVIWLLYFSVVVRTHNLWELFLVPVFLATFCFIAIKLAILVIKHRDKLW